MFSHLFRNRFPSTERFSFSHAGYLLSVTLRRRRNAKRLTLRVREDGLTLTVPGDVSVEDGRSFIREHFDWVRGQFKETEALSRSFDSGCDDGIPRIWYGGILTPVLLYRDERHEGKSLISHSDGSLVIRVSDGGFLGDYSSRLRPASLLERWLRVQAKVEIKRSLAEVLPLLGESPVPLSVRDQKTRWGSCSSSRRLSFNWRLVMAPRDSLHYVVVHEAAHLVHHDHSARFWGLVGDLMPDFAVHQRWLRDHQASLFASLEGRLRDLRPTRLGVGE